LTPDGVLAGTPIQAQTKKFSVTLKDDAGETFARNFSLQIFADNAVHITTQTLKAAKEGIPYSFQLTAQGGTEPYAWQILSGALPKGLTLSSTGDISGTSTEIGSFPLEIRVFDASTPPSFESKGFTLESQMAPLEIVGTMVFDLLVSKLVVLSPLIPYFPYAANLEARGGLKPYSWSQEPPPPVLNLFIQKWGLPKGLKMTQAGRISGSVTNTSDATTITIPGGPSLSGYFFMGKVSDSRSPSRSTSAIFCIPTIAL
jgi:hypothetical protein